MNMIQARTLTLAPSRESESDATGPSGRLSEFLDGLTQLSAECGIGITDAPHLYVMEPEDKLFSYAADDESRLILR
jgi:hypothetical protein